MLKMELPRVYRNSLVLRLTPEGKKHSFKTYRYRREESFILDSLFCYVFNDAAQ